MSDLGSGGGPAARSAAPSPADPALRPALLTMLSNQGLQLLPGQLLLRRQDGLWLTDTDPVGHFVGNHLLPVEMLTGSFCINFRLINISHCLLQTRAILLYPRAVPILPHVWLLKVTLLMKEIERC